MLVRVATATGVIMALIVVGQAQEPKKYGVGVSLTETTPLTHLIDRPADFEGKTVRVEGVVKAVCAGMGCWMAFAPAAAPDGRTVLIKVDDGVIVFPLSAKDRRAVAEGVVERIGTDAEAQEAGAEHAKAMPTPSASAPAAWLVKATGALVY